MESYEEDDVVGESQDSPPRRTRSGRPVGAKRGRGRKKAATPRATRATRNTRAKLSPEEGDTDSPGHEDFPNLLDLETETLESDGLEAIQAALDEPLEPAFCSDVVMMDDYLIEDPNNGVVLDEADGGEVIEETCIAADDDSPEEVQEIGEESSSGSDIQMLAEMPELSESPPPRVSVPTLSTPSELRMEADEGADSADGSEDLSLAAVREAAEETVLDAVNGWATQLLAAPVAPDTEEVSEDELPSENKEPLDTEAVSDDELPEQAQTADLPETEEVSEDELPPEKSYKKRKAQQAGGEDKASTDDADAEGAAKRSRKAVTQGEYDPDSPTSGDEKTAPSTTPNEDATPTSVEGKKKLPELDKYWTAVKEDPADFTGWTYLLQYVDQENDIEAAREAYDGFLSHYSYCYGYWRKYADYEKRKDNKDQCEEVFARGLAAIPLSVDLWLHFLNHRKAAAAADGADDDAVRGSFESAIEACGLEFRSDRLWESYIKWEVDAKRLPQALALYDRLLATPTQAYVTHFESFQTLVNAHAPNKLLSVDAFLEGRRAVLAQLKATPVPEAVAAPGDEAAAPPGDEPQEAVMPSNADETAALRERIIAARRKVHKATAAMVAERWVFEEGIKRPYFHVKPLERCQLKNWRDYLDFEVAQGDEARIVVLFERCLIACALYEDMWQKYLRYLAGKGETERMRDVYQRACTIHHPQKPSLHLAWAVFEETQGNFTKASTILSALDTAVPGVLAVAYRRINLERRQGKLDAAATLYRHYIETAKSKLLANNMAIKYARFCCKVRHDDALAAQILTDAIDKDKDNPRLYLQLVDLSLSRSPLDEAAVVAVFDRFLQSKDADTEQKVLFAQRKVEFLEDFGSAVASVQKAQEEFQKLCKQSKDKKKKASEESKSEAKKNKAGGDAAPAANGTAATPAAAGSFAAPPTGGYGAGYAPPTGYQGQYPGGQYPGGQYPAGQYPNQSDAGYAGYQNWGYSQAGYGGYNQGWTGNYNYY